MPSNNPFTFCITTFKRPGKLRRLVDSILKYCPGHAVAIADNGHKLPSMAPDNGHLFPECDYHVMPFDCGLSECRNYLASFRTYGDIIFLDDDFEFTNETEIYAMVDILEACPDVGIVCGSAGGIDPVPLGTHKIDGRRARCMQPIRFHTVDLADNFMLVRRELLNTILWNPGLKLGEHADFFQRVCQTAWRVAYVPSVKVRHDRDGDTREYTAFRQRKPGFQEVINRPEKDPPPIVVLGVGHSGTRIVVRMLESLGWKLGDVMSGVAESKTVQKLNKRMLLQRGICPCGSSGVTSGNGEVVCRRCLMKSNQDPVSDEEIVDTLTALPKPWVIKDPRMVLTWDRWKDLLRPHRPIILLVERNIDRMRKTYVKNGWHDFRIYGRHVSDLVQQANWHYQEWEGQYKFRLSYDTLADTVRLFDLTKAKS